MHFQNDVLLSCHCYLILRNICFIRNHSFICSDYAIFYAKYNRQPSVVANYYDPPDLTHELNFSETSNLSILHINIHSLRKHINDLQEFLSNSNFFPDIIAITETRIKDQSAINIDIPGYNFFFVKSFNNAGGVGVYINDTLNCAEF